MAKKKQSVRVFNEKDIELIRYVVSNFNVGFSPERITNGVDAYYLVRINLTDLTVNYARKDFSKKDTPSNRVVYREEDVWTELLSKYNETYLSYLKK
jgi:hypothetical protein